MALSAAAPDGDGAIGQRAQVHVAGGRTIQLFTAGRPARTAPPWVGCAGLPACVETYAGDDASVEEAPDAR